MGKPRRKVRHRSIEWFERGVPGKHMDEVEFCRVAAGHFPASRHFNAPTWSPERFSLALDVGGKNLTNYMFFVLFYCSLVCCCGTCWYFIYFSRTLTEFMDFSRRLLQFKTFSRVHEPWLPFPTHWQAKIT